MEETSTTSLNMSWRERALMDTATSFFLGLLTSESSVVPADVPAGRAPAPARTSAPAPVRSRDRGRGGRAPAGPGPDGLHRG